MPTPPVPKPRPDPVAERLQARLMQQSLRRLLDRVTGARDVLPHLAALENSLGKHGLALLETVPLHTLAKICSQLSSLPLPDDDPSLNALLTRLLDTLEAKSPRNQFQPTEVTEATLVIEDVVSHSEFMALQNADDDRRGGGQR